MSCIHFDAVSQMWKCLSNAFFSWTDLAKTLMKINSEAAKGNGTKL